MSDALQRIREKREQLKKSMKESSQEPANIEEELPDEAEKLKVEVEKVISKKPVSKDDANIVKIHLSSTMIRLIKRDWAEEIDLDEISKIDYSNLFGEVVTISALLNRVGNLKAEMEEQVNLEKLDGEVFEAQKRSYHSKEAAQLGQKLTVQGLEDRLLEDPEVIAKRKKLIQTQKNKGLIDSLYWAVQSKDQKLSKLLKPVTPVEFESELVEREINGFIIKKSKHVL